MLYSPYKCTPVQVLIYHGQLVVAQTKAEHAAFTHVGLVNANLDVHDATLGQGTAVRSVEDFAAKGVVRVMRFNGITKDQQHALSAEVAELKGDYSVWQIFVDQVLDQVLARGPQVLRLRPDWEQMAQKVLNGGNRDVFYCSRLVSLAYAYALNYKVGGRHAAVAMPCHFSASQEFHEVVTYW